MAPCSACRIPPPGAVNWAGTLNKIHRVPALSASVSEPLWIRTKLIKLNPPPNVSAMGYLSLSFLTVLLCSTGAWKPPKALRRTAQGKRAVSRRETPNLPPPYLNLPMSVESRFPLVAKEYFSPAAGTGLEPLPPAVREILIPTAWSTRPPNVSGVHVKTWCEDDKMFVEVPRSILGDGGGGDVSSQVKVGTCRANFSTPVHLTFEFDLWSCGTLQSVSRQVNGQSVMMTTCVNNQHFIRAVLQRLCSRSRHLASGGWFPACYLLTEVWTGTRLRTEILAYCLKPPIKLLTSPKFLKSVTSWLLPVKARVLFDLSFFFLLFAGQSFHRW